MPIPMSVLLSFLFGATSACFFVGNVSKRIDPASKAALHIYGVVILLVMSVIVICGLIAQHFGWMS